MLGFIEVSCRLAGLRGTRLGARTTAASLGQRTICNHTRFRAFLPSATLRLWSVCRVGQTLLSVRYVIAEDERTGKSACPTGTWQQAKLPVTAPLQEIYCVRSRSAHSNARVRTSPGAGYFDVRQKLRPEGLT